MSLSHVVSLFCGIAAIVPTQPTLSAGAIHSIMHGGIHVEPEWIPPRLITALRTDAEDLFARGLFSPDGLTNTAVDKAKQGFTREDRQTFRGDGWRSKVGNLEARLEFAERMYALRCELAAGLGRPTLADEGVRKHEMTYNWYEPGARLGRHLDEHHEETKGVKGWAMPTRRSVTWLVYLNDGWRAADGGALRTFPREELSAEPVGADHGNLQVGWLEGTRPVFMDSTADDGRSVLYCRVPGGVGRDGGRDDGGRDDGGRELLSERFEVPRQPIHFGAFVRPAHASGFEQISTSRLDPRFASGAPSEFAEFAGTHHVDVTPAAGTLVVFDSVSLPHLVREVTAPRQRIAATGWFHEDSQLVL